MSYNGSGTFVINSSGQPVVTGTVISSTAFNALTADLATGLSTAITKDGQTTTTSRILFAQGISSTLVTDATSATTGSIITAGGISTQKALWVGTTSRLVGNTQHDGLVGIGMTPSNVLDITQTQNAASKIKLLNENTSTAAASELRLSNLTNNAQFLMYGTGFTTSGVSRQDGLFIGAGGAGGVTLTTQAAQPIYFGINSTEKARIGSDGSLLVGTTTSSGAISNVAPVSAGGFSTVNSTVSLTANTAATLVTIPSGSRSSYLVSICLNVVDAGNYGAAAIIVVDNSSASLTTIKVGALMTLSMSGLNIQATTTVTSLAYFSVIRLMTH